MKREKRRPWHEQQNKRLSLPSQDPREFWKQICSIGIVQERTKQIPMERVQNDGCVVTDTVTVLSKLQTDFHSLLNRNTNYEQSVNGLFR